MPNNFPYKGGEEKMQSKFVPKKTIQAVVISLMLGVGLSACGGGDGDSSEVMVKLKPRTIVTQDAEVDDQNSFMRFLYYANEFDVKGVIFTPWSNHIQRSSWSGESVVRIVGRSLLPGECLPMDGRQRRQSGDRHTGCLLPARSLGGGVPERFRCESCLGRSFGVSQCQPPPCSHRPAVTGRHRERWRGRADKRRNVRQGR